MPSEPAAADVLECCICGATDDVRCCPIMTGDRFGEPPKYPVCGACIRVWHESGETTAGGIRKRRELEVARKRVRELEAELA